MLRKVTCETCGSRSFANNCHTDCALCLNDAFAAAVGCVWAKQLQTKLLPSLVAGRGEDGTDSGVISYLLPHGNAASDFRRRYIGLMLLGPPVTAWYFNGQGQSWVRAPPWTHGEDNLPWTHAPSQTRPTPSPSLFRKLTWMSNGAAAYIRGQNEDIMERVLNFLYGVDWVIESFRAIPL